MMETKVPEYEPAPLRVLCPLHGIRTLAEWQKVLSDLADEEGWACRLNRWSYGRFSVFAFLTPWTREAMLGWLRRQYDAEINDRQLEIEAGQVPSVVAHSFGTYILGYTLLRFDFIRFDKVVLCGSILPLNFPWDMLIARGQVQAVRNEYGVRDPWVRRVSWFVRGTGPSGTLKFTCNHERLEQEKFDYDHGEYFGRDHMKDRWVPFLNRRLDKIPRGTSDYIEPPPVPQPWGLYITIFVLLALITALLYWVANPDRRNCPDSFEGALKYINMDEINTGFPTFMKRFHNCNVKWSGVVVGAGPRSCLLKVKDPKDPTQMRMRANFSLDDDIVPSDLGAGSVVELQGTIVNLSERTIFVENAHDLQIVTKVTKVDEDKNKGAKR